MAERRKDYHRVHVRHPVYNELQLESAKQNKPISQLADLAFAKYLQNAFLKPSKPEKRSRRSRPKRLKPYNWDNHLVLDKRIGIYDSAYRLLEQESQRTGKSVQCIATNAFIEYLQNIKSEINRVDML